MQVDFPEGGQGGCYAVQFLFKSRAFLLENADYRLRQCFGHESSYHSHREPRRFLRNVLVNWRNIL